MASGNTYRDRVTVRAWQFNSWGDPELADHAAPAAGDVEASLALVPHLPAPGELGRSTWSVFSALATLGAIDLGTARTLEPHLDATEILHQCDPVDLGPLEVTTNSRWGVYAAKAPGLHLGATRDSAQGWLLNGSKPWCSLATRVSHALVTADRDGRSQLFAVRLRDTTARPSQWSARGLSEIDTVTLDFTDVPAVAIGDPGWYLTRPGFWWGAIGVAAVWFGGAAAVAGALLARAAEREDDSDLTLAAIGRVDVALHGALTSLRAAAQVIDDPDQDGDQLLATRVRSQMAACVDEVLHTVGRTLGPSALAHDAGHAKRVADLSLYVRQHHGERDLATLGRLALDA